MKVAKLRTADEILALRVADIAMGSGAFLVAAARMPRVTSVTSLTS
ncbi:MAG: hypothetical protein ACLP8X_07095 [Streptosporangiaceae bacterium]